MERVSEDLQIMILSSSISHNSTVLAKNYRVQGDFPEEELKVTETDIKARLDDLGYKHEVLTFYQGGGIATIDIAVSWE